MSRTSVNNIRWEILAILALMFSMLPGGALAADSPRLGPGLQKKLATVGVATEIPIIVRMQSSVKLQSLAIPSRKKGPQRRRQRAAMIRSLQTGAKQNRQPLQEVLNRHGIDQARSLWLINGMALQATPGLIEEISRIPQVVSIELDQVIEAPVVEPALATGSVETNIDLINAPALWSLGYRGQGVTVAVVDTGVDVDHPDLASRWRGGDNSWYDPNGEHPDRPIDLEGHGTSVTGLVLGGNNDGSFIGVAPDAQWIAVKIFNDRDRALSSAIHAGYQWLLDPDGDPDTDDAPDIVSNSWGVNPDDGGICDPTFQTDIQSLKAAGIAVVFSAGNSGPDSNSSVSPGNYPESFAVGSVGTYSSETEISDFSARGPSSCDGTIYPEVVAAGDAPHRIDDGASVYGIKTSDLTSRKSYAYVAGTSFSAPQASGVMALLLSAFPEASVDTIQTALMQSATDLGPYREDNAYGYGLVNALAAFDLLDGQYHMSVTDSLAPETDGKLSFGEIPMDSFVSAAVRVRNTGGLPLPLDLVDDSNVASPFSITSDDCSGSLLQIGESCSMEVRFAPTADGDYTGSLEVSAASGAEQMTVELRGSGGTVGTKIISVRDSVSPQTDGIVAFAQVVPGSSASASISVRNVGSAVLNLGQVDTNLIRPPFSIVSDACSGQALLAGATCTINVRFAPTVPGEFSASLAVLSDATDRARVTVDLTGTGNTLPVAPDLLAPDNSARTGRDVTFSWLPASDADGDSIAQFLVYSSRADFSPATSVPVGTVPAAALAAGGLALFALAAGLIRRRKLALLVMISGFLLLMVSCGGGGGGGDGGTDENLLPADAQSETVTGLVPGTTYYWKMLARDSRGGETESEVRSFVVE